MERLDTEDGQLFIKNLASFVRTHEKALANALQMKRQPPKNAQQPVSSGSLLSPTTPNTYVSSTSNTLAAALSFGTLSFTSHSIKPAKLTLTPHHLFYLLSRVEELSIPVGPMSVRLENIHTESSPANYVSFLNKAQRPKGKSDRDSIHSVSSVRSVMSGMSSLWSSFGLGSSTASKSEKAKAAAEADLKYLYSAFTKIPCLRLSPDHRARLIRGYEEFPFDTAVPLYAFKNVSALEVIDVDFRQFFGWDRLAEQPRTLTVKRANLDDPGDLLTGIVLDDMDKRRRRSSKAQTSPVTAYSAPSPPRTGLGRSNSAPSSPILDVKFSASASPQSSSMIRGGSEGLKGLGPSAMEDDQAVKPKSSGHHSASGHQVDVAAGAYNPGKHPHRTRTGSISPNRPHSRHANSTSYRHMRGNSTKVKRSGSGSSNSSEQSVGPYRSGSSSNLLTLGILPPSKWRFLRHLSLVDNSLTSISMSSLAPLANTLHSLDLSSNLFTEVPDSLASLVALRALNLSNCMIESLHSLARNPLPAITALNLRANRLRSIAGIERLLSLERLDLRENRLSDPTEGARLTGIPDIREIWVAQNPFTKSHSGYRVVIFNLFRKTPGYAEDILLDATGPGYSERKQLIDRVAEPERAPVMRLMEKDDAPPSTVAAAIRKVDANEDQKDQKDTSQSRQRPVMQSTQSEYPIGPRRRKGPRRRIVDLSREEPQLEGGALPTAMPIMKNAEMDIRGSPDEFSPKSRPEHMSLDQGSVGTRANAQQPPRIDTEWNAYGDVYRQRLEALKQEVGDRWLSVLGDEAWTSNHGLRVNGGVDFSTAGTLRPGPTTPRANSQAIVSGGRTLG